jgi:hypothetical protein
MLTSPVSAPAFYTRLVRERATSTLSGHAGACSRNFPRLDHQLVHVNANVCVYLNSAPVTPLVGLDVHILLSIFAVDTRRSPNGNSVVAGSMAKVAVNDD